MELEGKIIFVGEEKSGVSQSGKEWRKNEFVIETHERYPKKCCFTVFNDRCDTLPSAGTEVKVSFDVDAREWNGRYFNEVTAFKIEMAGYVEQPAHQPAPKPVPQQHEGVHPVEKKKETAEPKKEEKSDNEDTELLPF